jgi:predicted dehydrogenase
MEGGVLRLAVIGCGAIADTFHLPALERGAAGDVALILVDPSAERASALGRKYGASSTACSHTEIIGRVDAAVIASPHHTHVPIALDLIGAGVAVLSEKPLGTSVAEVEAVRDASQRHGCIVAVNQTRRFIPACQEIRRRIDAGDLGEVWRVDASEGDRFGWPAATPSMFGTRSGGQGVLLDIGVHVIDLLTCWFGADLAVDSFRDDSFGGSEAAAVATLSRGDLRLDIRLSWLAKLRNAVRISGTEGTLEWNVYDLDTFTLHSHGSGRPSRVRLDGAPREYNDLAVPVLRDFRQAIDTGGPPAVRPEDALASMRIIERCYQIRQRFDMPWHNFRSSVAHAR